MFLPITLMCYYAAPKKVRNLVLFLLSLVFYAWGEPVYVGIMLFSTFFDYFNGLMLEKFKKDSARKAVLILSLIVNLGILFFFKYYDFAIRNLNLLFNLHLSVHRLSLPLGISFYTFQTLSYTIDVYRKEVKAQRNIIDFGSYIAMFPQLVAGPIVRYIDIQKELENKDISFSNFSTGVKRFIYGLAKKVLIANNVGELYHIIKAVNPASLSFLDAWIGAIAFMLQIYFDFSGYSDMAIGMGKMLGFNFLENFNLPYTSKSISEFWRRWHMSLSLWFRSYVYIPLGGNRVKISRNIFNLFVTWSLTGIWHGAEWNFLIWGIYYFLILSCEKFIYKDKLEKAPDIIRHLYTLLLVIIGWVIFEQTDVKGIGLYLRAMFVPLKLFNDSSIFYLREYILIIIIACLLCSNLFKKYVDELLFKKYKLAEYIFLITLITISTLYLVNESYNPFLYFRF